MQQNDKWKEKFTNGKRNRKKKSRSRFCRNLEEGQDKGWGADALATAIQNALRDAGKGMKIYISSAIRRKIGFTQNVTTAAEELPMLSKSIDQHLGRRYRGRVTFHTCMYNNRNNFPF